MRARLFLIVTTLALGGLAAACAQSAPAHRSRASSSPTTAPAATRAPEAAHPRRVIARRASWQLPSPRSRLVALTDGSRIVLAGGLDPGDVSTDEVLSVDVHSGRVHRVATLAAAVHDTAGALVNGHVVLFGGGGATETADVQEVQGSHARVIGHLPVPRSDLSVVPVDGHLVVLGGYNGVIEVPGVLRTTTGTSFRRIAPLPITVRYAATVATGSTVWVIGGEHPRVPIDAIQRIDTATGRARVVGNLPHPISDAVAFTLGGRILVAGGRTSSGQASRLVFAFDPRTRSAHVVAKLPVGVADAAATVIGNVGYVVGGEASTQLRVVQEVRLGR